MSPQSYRGLTAIVLRRNQFAKKEVKGPAMMAEAKCTNSFGWPSSQDGAAATTTASSGQSHDEAAPEISEPKRKRFNAFHVVRKIFRRKSKPPLKNGREKSTTIKSRSTGELAILVASCSGERHTSSPTSVCCDLPDENMSSPCNGLSLSHDSVFAPELEEPGPSPSKVPKKQGFSYGLPVFSSGLKEELANKVRSRHVESDDDDAGLPHSPSTSPTTAEILHQGLMEKSTRFRSSDGSLLSMGSSETDNEDVTSPAKLLFDNAGADPDLDVGTTVLLNSRAARHKIAIRPRRNHAVPQQRIVQTTAVGSTLPTTPEDNEETLPVNTNQTKFSSSKEVSKPQQTSVKSRSQSVTTKSSPDNSPTTALPRCQSVREAIKSPTEDDNNVTVSTSGTESSSKRPQAAERKLRHEIKMFTQRKSLENSIENVITPPLSPPDHDTKTDIDSQEVFEDEDESSTRCFGFSLSSKKESTSSTTEKTVVAEKKDDSVESLYNNLFARPPRILRKVDNKKDAHEYGFTGDGTTARTKAVGSIENKVDEPAVIAEPKISAVPIPVPDYDADIVKETVTKELNSNDSTDLHRRRETSGVSRSNSIKRLSERMAKFHEKFESAHVNVPKKDDSETPEPDYNDNKIDNKNIPKKTSLDLQSPSTTKDDKFIPKKSSIDLQSPLIIKDDNKPSLLGQQSKINVNVVHPKPDIFNVPADAGMDDSFETAFMKEPLNRRQVKREASTSREHDDQRIANIADPRRKPLEQQLSKEDIDELEKSSKSLPPSPGEGRESKVLPNVTIRSFKDGAPKEIHKRPLSLQIEKRANANLNVQTTLSGSPNDSGLQPFHNRVKQQGVNNKLNSTERKASAEFADKTILLLSPLSVIENVQLPPPVSRRQSADKAMPDFRQRSIDISPSDLKPQIQKTSPPPKDVIKEIIPVINEKPAEKIAEKLPEPELKADTNKDAEPTPSSTFGITLRTSIRIKSKEKPPLPEKHDSVHDVNPLKPVPVQTSPGSDASLDNNVTVRETRLFGPHMLRPKTISSIVELRNNSSSTNAIEPATSSNSETPVNSSQTTGEIPQKSDIIITPQEKPESKMINKFLVSKETKSMLFKSPQPFERRPSTKVDASMKSAFLTDSFNIEITEVAKTTVAAAPANTGKPEIPIKRPISESENRKSLLTTSNSVTMENLRFQKSSFLEDSGNSKFGTSFISSINRRPSMNANRPTSLVDFSNVEKSKTTVEKDNKIESPTVPPAETRASDVQKSQLSRAKSDAGSLRIPTVTSVNMNNNSAVDNLKSLPQPKVTISRPTAQSSETSKVDKSIVVNEKDSLGVENLNNNNNHSVSSGNNHSVSPGWRELVKKRKEEKELQQQQIEREASIIDASTIIIREPEVKPKQVARNSKVLNMVSSFQNRQVC